MTSDSHSILIVDDNPEMLDFLVVCIGSANFGYQTATNGFECVSLLQQRQFDLILLDVNMPGMNGLEVLEYMASNNINIPIILLTVNDSVSLPNDLQQLGVRNYLVKGAFTADDLINEIKIILVRDRPSILVVDDDPAIHMLLNDINKKWLNYNFVNVEYGYEAKDLIIRHQPDLILLDYHLPDMTGLELLKLLPSIGNVKDLSVVLMTKDTDTIIAIQFIRLGIVDYLMKPINIAEAVSIIKNGLSMANTKARSKALIDRIRRANEQLQNRNQVIRSIEAIHRMLSESADNIDRVLKSIISQQLALLDMYDEIVIVIGTGRGPRILRRNESSKVISDDQVLRVETFFKDELQPSITWHHEIIRSSKSVTIALPLSFNKIHIGAFLAQRRVEYIGTFSENEITYLKIVTTILSNYIYFKRG
ncbi:MAG: response regulator [Anaerolineae bacterium]|nr:response regulator [Anaerolineae bacterium]